MRKHSLLSVFLGVVLALAATSVQAVTLIDLQMDEGAGTTVYDASGYGNDGEFEDLGTLGTMSWVAGHNGSGVKMRDDDIRVGASASLNITGAMHASMWVNPQGNGQWNMVGDPNQGGGLVEFLASADWGFSKGQAYGIYVPGNANVHAVFAFKNAGTKDWNADGALLTGRLIAGQWNQMEIGFDGVQTYWVTVNGVQFLAPLLPAPDEIVQKTTSALYIGTNKWTNGRLKGSVDEFVIDGVPGVPEPGSILALGMGLVSLAGVAMRRRTR